MLKVGLKKWTGSLRMPENKALSGIFLLIISLFTYKMRLVAGKKMTPYTPILKNLFDIGGFPAIFFGNLNRLYFTFYNGSHNVYLLNPEKWAKIYRVSRGRGYAYAVRVGVGGIYV